MLGDLVVLNIQASFAILAATVLTKQIVSFEAFLLMGQQHSLQNGVL
jgi:hypothetical protein